jgi:hypothetical protein
MKRKESAVQIPLYDYRAALQGALSWLGDRHLLAEPVARLREERTPYFTEPRRWHPAVIASSSMTRSDRSDSPRPGRSTSL